jgi:rhodanese-related sulfurtransferase
VREVSELEANGYIEGAVNIPIRDLLKNLGGGINAWFAAELPVVK